MAHAWTSECSALCKVDCRCRANKRRGISVPVDELYGFSGEGGHKTTENQFMVHQTERAITVLPKEQCSLVVLVGGLSCSKTSHILDVPMSMVMSRLAGARKTLAMQLLSGDAE